MKNWTNNNHTFKASILIMIIFIFIISNVCFADPLSKVMDMSALNLFSKNFYEGALGSPLALLFTTLIFVSFWLAQLICRKISYKLKEIIKIARLDRCIISQLFDTEIKISNTDLDVIDRLWKEMQKLHTYLVIVYGLPTMFGMLGTVCSLIASDLSNALDLAEKFSVAIVSTALGIIAYIAIRIMFFSLDHQMKDLERNIELVEKKMTNSGESH